MTAPRRWLVINPNTNPAMIEALLAEVARHAPSGAVIKGATATFGFPVIATRVSFAIAAHAALDVYAAHGEEVDAIILGCFGDPGLGALREIAWVTVVGLAEAPFTAATGPGGLLSRNDHSKPGDD